MKELINFLTDWGDISVGVVFVLIPFSAFVALFHHVILGGIYGWDYKPKWLLFVLEPTLVCVGASFCTYFCVGYCRPYHNAFGEEIKKSQS